MHQRRTAVIFLTIVVLAAVGGWLLGRQVTSPAEIAARTAEPEPSPILVPVETRVLSTDVVTRGTGRFGSPREVTLPATALKDDRLVVTTTPEPGSSVEEGDVLLTVSNRPVIVMLGEVPGFRDLGRGMTGVDVEQLEMGLERLGLLTVPPDDRYDASTEQAVLALYERASAPPAMATQAQLSELLPSTGSLFPGSVPDPGAVVPADELVFVPNLPARVAELTLVAGQPLDGAVLTLTDANVAVDGSLPIEQSGLVTAGMEVLIDEPDLGIGATGVVSRIADAPGTDGLDGFHVYFEVTVADAPANLVNASVRLTVPIDTTGSDVLVVPIAALNLAADGSSVVRVDRGGTLETIEVQPGLSAEGFVAVEAVNGTLDAGDLVLIGFERAAGR